MPTRIWTRWLGMHAWQGYWRRKRMFNEAALQAITAQIEASEENHSGELMVAIEASMPAHEKDSRLRALEVFGRLGAWDTPQNTGVLLYLALDRSRIEIIADRGIEVSQETWEEICARLALALSQGSYLEGVLTAIVDIEAVLRASCPPVEGDSGNFLLDAPVVL